MLQGHVMYAGQTVPLTSCVDVGLTTEFCKFLIVPHSTPRALQTKPEKGVSSSTSPALQSFSPTKLEPIFSAFL